MTRAKSAKDAKRDLGKEGEMRRKVDRALRARWGMARISHEGTKKNGGHVSCALKAQRKSAQGKRSAALGNSKNVCALKGRW